MCSERRNSILSSLRFRLTMAYAAAFGVGLALVFALFAALLQRSAAWQAEAMMESEARRLLDLAGRRKARILQAELERVAQHHGPGNIHVVLYSPAGDALAASDGSAWQALPAAPPRPPAPGVPRFSAAAAAGRHIRTVVLSSADGHSIRLSRSLEGFERQLRLSGPVLLTGFAASLLLGTALAYLLTRHAMLRVDRVRRTAAAIAEGDLARRVPAEEERDEVAALADTFNRMIDKLEAAFEELRAVTDGMAHDVRTPLTRMRGAAEAALVAGGVAPQPAEALALVVEECDRLERMSSTLLQIVRMDAGAYAPSLQTLDLGALLREAAELLGPALEDKGLEARADAIEGGLLVRGDRPLLERMLANLLDNAAKFTPAGGRITVASRKVSPNHAELTVSDTGIGIDEQDLSHVFDRFYRSDRSRSAAGWGLGLSFVQAAVRLHGGTISVASRPGQGTTFTLRLPLAPAA